MAKTLSMENVAELRPKGIGHSKSKRQHRSASKRRTKMPAIEAVSLAAPAVSTPREMAVFPNTVMSAAVLLSALSLAAVSAFFGITGMTTIFAAAVIPVRVMTGALEVAKLVTTAWLARHWSVAPLALRAPLVIIVVLLMALTAVGTFGFLSRAHLTERAAAAEAIDRSAAPLAQQIALAESRIKDIDVRIAQLDGMVNVSTAHGHTKLAMVLVRDQAVRRGDLVAERQKVAQQLANLRIDEIGIEAQRANLSSESGPALYLANLFGSDNIEGTVRVITALLVLVLDPLAVLLTIAATWRPKVNAATSGRLKTR
jgi:hypothetical protein